MFKSVLLALHLALSPVAQKITSVFENGTPVLRYSYVQDLRDGRGFTAGIVGFTTANGDALDVVRALNRRRPHNRLARYVPALSRLAGRESGDIRALRGFDQAWRTESTQADFRAAQNEVAARLYAAPALAYAAIMGVRTPLGVECLYDACVQHGDGDDRDGLRALIIEAARFGTPSGRAPGGRHCARISESLFVQQFLSVRMFHLQHAADPETRAVWAQSYDRCHALANLTRSGNWQLKTPIRLKSRDYDEFIR